MSSEYNINYQTTVVHSEPNASEIPIHMHGYISLSCKIWLWQFQSNLHLSDWDKLLLPLGRGSFYKSLTFSLVKFQDFSTINTLHHWRWREIRYLIFLWKGLNLAHWHRWLALSPRVLLGFKVNWYNFMFLYCGHHEKGWERWLSLQQLLSLVQKISSCVMNQ